MSAPQRTLIAFYYNIRW